jgi:hypothetical protein
MGTCVYDDHTAPEEMVAPIPDGQWSVYRQVIAEARENGIRFALGGGMAVSVYTGQWRPSKDLDIYVFPEQRERMIEITRRAGLADYFEKRPYDRSWIYRSWADDVIVDVMWAMANHKAPIDQRWLSCGARVNVNGEHLRVLPVEELIWDKLYVLQRDRCDWPEVMKLLYAVGPGLCWEQLFARVGNDLPLLAAALTIFRWMCPGRAEEFPAWVWQRVDGVLPPPGRGCEVERAHVDLLDRRAWFPTPEPALC